MTVIRLPLAKLIAACLLTFGLMAGTVCSADKMPAAKAGEIGTPTGKIAFIRDKNVWTMDAHGGNQTKICEIRNADGRLSWAPDGKRIVFTRSGTVSLQAPDNLGGKHKVYDIFIAYVDSAVTGNTFFWRRLSGDLGSRDPEWSADGSSIIYFKDMNANSVNAELPNYQVCVMDTTGENSEILRKDWRNMAEYLKNPTMNARSEIVAEHFQLGSGGGGGGSFKTKGLVRLPKDAFQISVDSINRLSNKTPGKVAPAWSPDGKWIAYVSNSMTNPGIFVASPDFAEDYLVFAPPPGVSLYTMAPSFSPNSKWLTFATTDGSIWTCDITGGNPKRLTGPGLDWAPAWSKTGIAEMGK